MESPTGPASGPAVAGGSLALAATAAAPENGGSPSSSTMQALPRVCPACGGRYPQSFKVCPHDATPLDDARDSVIDPLIGATLADSYQVVRVIGEGGMGRVYEARHTRLHNKRFAIKMLLDEYARQTDVVARFQREAESASGIAHPNIVGVYDVHRTEDGRPYIVGEYLDGEELGAMLDRVEKLETGFAVRIVRQVCSALEAAHNAGVVHRDMKPENVFLVGPPAAPLAKILDFGISKQASNGTLTQTGMVMGTPSYMAPEQARGAKVDHRVDIYAAGAILYRALTGEKPFDGEPAEILTAVLTEEPPRPRQLDPSISEALELVIQRAMAKEPGDRYQHMAELEAALARFDPLGPLPSQGTTVLAPAPNTAPGLAKPGDRTLPASSVAGLGWSIEEASREARLARPLLVVLSIVAYLWAIAGVVAVLADCLRLAHGKGSTISSTESVLVVAGTLLATVTPALLWVRHVARRVWTNSVRSVQQARRLKTSLVASVAAYGLGALLVHVFEGVVQRSPMDHTTSAWSILLVVLALIAGAVPWLIPVRRG